MSEEALFKVAEEARLCAYAPYSDFSVGAALELVDGRIFAGCNVENVSYGLTMCAERVALGAAVAAGNRDFSCLALVSDSTEPVLPCGACRQVLAEFSPALRILSRTVSGLSGSFMLSELLPKPRQGILQ